MLKGVKKCCTRCGSPGKKSRDETETLFCPKCGIWLEEELEIPTEPSNESKLAEDYSPTMGEAEAHACQPNEPAIPYTLDSVWEDAWKDMIKKATLKP